MKSWVLTQTAPHNFHDSLWIAFVFAPI